MTAMATKRHREGARRGASVPRSSALGRGWLMRHGLVLVAAIALSCGAEGRSIDATVNWFVKPSASFTNILSRCESCMDNTPYGMRSVISVMCHRRDSQEWWSVLLIGDHGRVVRVEVGAKDLACKWPEDMDVGSVGKSAFAPKPKGSCFDARISVLEAYANMHAQYPQHSEVLSAVYSCSTYLWSMRTLDSCYDESSDGTWSEKRIEIEHKYDRREDLEVDVEFP